MWNLLKNIFSPTQYIPHGHCYLWQTPLVWLHVLSDALIAIAYFSIPATLIYFVSQRKDTPFSKVFILFSGFIIACGTGHLLDIWTLWHPAYWLSGGERAITALISCYTALELVTLLPQFLELKTPEELENINQKLQQEIIERQETEFTLKTILAGTASLTGEKFLPALATHLAQSLNVKYVFITELIDKENLKVKTLTFCENQTMLDNFEYSLENTPCREVIEKKLPVCYADKITTLFPENQYLRRLKAVSYLGLPLLNNLNQVIGSLCVVDTKPLINFEKSLTIMQVFASRASAEIQRQKATDDLSLAYAKLEEKVQERTAELESLLLSLKQEIAKREKFEKALKIEQNQLRQIIKNAPVAIAMLDQNMNYLAHSYKWISDYNLEDYSNTIGRSFYETFPNLSEKWLNIHRRVLQGESISQNEDIIEYNGKTFYLSWAFEPWFISEKKIGGMIIVTQNIEDLVKAREIALETAQLKSSFLANMSHEIRTPMSGILGIVEILKKTPLSDEQKKYIETLDNSSNHLLFIINDILDFSKLEAKEMQLEYVEFSLYNCLESVLGIFFNQAENKGLDLLTLVEKNIPIFIKGDNNRLRQILLNLVGNAIKFTEQGQIIIKIAKDSETINQVKLKFEIIDTGIGISQENQQKLFNSFTQVDTSTTRKYGGTGLGLAICKSLVELMQGEIGVESELNQGSKFWFTAYFTKGKNQENSGIKLAEKNLNNKNVLLIDFSKTRCKIMQQQLEFWGMKCQYYSNCLEGVLTLQKESNSQAVFDIVLVNWDKETTENDQLIYQVILTHPRLIQAKHILMISPEIYSDQSDWLKENNINHLVKPFHIFQLIQSILMTCSVENKTVNENINTASNKLELDRENLAITQTQILLVEDTPVNQLVITELLKTLGYSNVDRADNGKIAIDKLRGKHYDLILMDCLMPVLDGYETTKIIRQQEAENKKKPSIIIAMTANALAGEKEKCLKVGMDDYISKPVEMKTLAKTLSHWLMTVNQRNDHLNLITQIITYESLIDETFSKIYGHNPEDNREILMMYVDDAQFYLDDLKRAYSEQNSEKISHFVAEFKGISETIGIKLIPDWLSAIDNFAQESSFAQIEPLLDNITTALQILEAQ